MWRFSRTRAAEPPDKIIVLLCGVIFPAAVITWEYAEGLFGHFFYEVVRPLPLALMVLIVPVSNVLYLRDVRRAREIGPVTARLAAMAQGTCCVYALPYLALLGSLMLEILSLRNPDIVSVGGQLVAFGFLLVSLTALWVPFLACRAICRVAGQSGLHGRLLLRQGYLAAVAALLLCSGPNIAVRLGLFLNQSGHTDAGTRILRIGADRHDWLRAGCPGSRSVTDVFVVPFPISQRYARQQYGAVTGRNFETDVKAELENCLDSMKTVRPPRN